MDDSLGRRFGKPDIERLGWFSEMSYMNGKGYVPLIPRGKPINGENFLNTGTRSRTGTQHGYFEEEYKRLFIGEGITRPGKITKEKTLTPFIVNSVPKKHATPGDNYGTFTKHMDGFSPIQQATRYKHEAPNFLWRSGKVGGPGYADTGIDKWPEHLPDPYGLKLKVKIYGKNQGGPFHYANYPTKYFDKNPYLETSVPTVGYYLDRRRPPQASRYGDFLPTGPAKWQGGCHAGCFEPFPSFMPCRYVSFLEANKPRGDAKTVMEPFMAIPQVPKTQYTTSIMDHSVDVFMNTKNCKTYVPCYVKHLLSESDSLY